MEAEQYASDAEIRRDKRRFGHYDTTRQISRRHFSSVCQSIPTANAQFIRPFDLGVPTFGHIPAIVNSPDSGQNRQNAGKSCI
jgi:hypothetical protein